MRDRILRKYGTWTDFWADVIVQGILEVIRLIVILAWVKMVLL